MYSLPFYMRAHLYAYNDFINKGVAIYNVVHKYEPCTTHLNVICPPQYTFTHIGTIANKQRFTLML